MLEEWLGEEVGNFYIADPTNTLAVEGMAWFERMMLKGG